MIKANVIRNYTDIDARSSSLYDSIMYVDLPQASFDFTRLIYLFLLQTLTQKTPLVSSMTSHFRLYQGFNRRPEIPKDQSVPPMLSLPSIPSSFDYFHLSAEFGYEFIRGTRMVDSDTLNRCEQNITEFEIQFHAALDYTREGINENDFEIQREGIFRVADSFMRITDMTW